MRTYADDSVSMRIPSLLDQLTDKQMEELQRLAKCDSEHPTVSERLSEMMAKVSQDNKAVQEAVQAARESAQDKFADLLATPLHKLAKDLDFEDEAA